MRIISLTQGLAALVDDVDFTRLSKFKWWATKGRKTWYAMTTVKGRLTRMHKLVRRGNFWVDHRDGNGLNNQRKNLRRCNPVQNGAHSQMKGSNTTGIKGVSWDSARSKWAACICVSYRTIHLGRFTEKIAAANAYDAAAQKHFGRFALTNKMMRNGHS